MCGLIKRDTLPDVDLGFAFLPRHWGNGYALEAAEATMAYARGALGLKRVVAILSQDNERSAHCSASWASCRGTITMPGDDEVLELYASEPDRELVVAASSWRWASRRPSAGTGSALLPRRRRRPAELRRRGDHGALRLLGDRDRLPGLVYGLCGSSASA